MASILEQKWGKPVKKAARGQNVEMSVILNEFIREVVEAFQDAVERLGGSTTVIKPRLMHPSAEVTVFDKEQMFADTLIIYIDPDSFHFGAKAFADSILDMGYHEWRGLRPTTLGAMVAKERYPDGIPED